MESSSCQFYNFANFFIWDKDDFKKITLLNNTRFYVIILNSSFIALDIYNAFIFPFSIIEYSKFFQFFFWFSGNLHLSIFLKQSCKILFFTCLLWTKKWIWQKKLFFVFNFFTESVSTKSLETCFRLMKIIKTDLTMLIIL